MNATPRFALWRNSVLLASVPLLLAACRHAAPPVAAAQTSVSPRDAASGRSIQHSAAYGKAVSLFQKKDFPAALAVVESLARQPGLSSADREFLNRQSAICKSAVGTPLAASSTAVPIVGREGAPALGRSKQRPYDGPPPPPAALGDCGPRALPIVAGKMGVKADATSLAKIAGTSRHGTNLEGMAKAAQSIGLDAEGVQVDRAALKQLDTQAIAWVDGDHFLAVLKVAEDQ